MLGVITSNVSAGRKGWIVLRMTPAHTGQNGDESVRILQFGSGRKSPQSTYLAPPYAPTAPAGGGIAGAAHVAQPGLHELGSGVAAATSAPHLIVARLVLAVT